MRFSWGFSLVQKDGGEDLCQSFFYYPQQGIVGEDEYGWPDIGQSQKKALDTLLQYLP
jgi:hypothetical protein